MKNKKSKAKRRTRKRQQKTQERHKTVVRSFTKTIPRPANAGDQCFKCGHPVEYRETRSRPRLGQVYGFRGFLWCDRCGTLYHCEKYRYRIDPSAVVDTEPQYPPLPWSWKGEFLQQVKQEIAKLDLEHERYVQAQIRLPRLIKKAEIQERK